MSRSVMQAMTYGQRWFASIDPWTQSLFLAATRCYLAWVFLRAGLVKIQSWDSTLMLFEYEYAVPLLSAVAAAWLATIAELVLPVMLALGAATRVAAVGLLVLNTVAATSYPDISAAGLKDHHLWGALALVLLLFGGGRIAVDAWIRQGMGLADGQVN